MKFIVRVSSLFEQSLLILVFTLVFLYDAFAGVIGFLDEFTALLSFIVLFYFIAIKGKLRLYRKEYYIVLLLGVIIVIGLSSNYFAYRNGHKTAWLAIIGDFINFYKAFITYIAIRLLSNSFDANKVLKKTAKYAEIIFYLLFVIVILDFIFKIFPHPPRYGIYSFELFFKHASRYGFAFSFIFLVLLPKYYKKNKGLLLFILLVGMLSLRVKYFGFLGMSIVFMFYGKRLFKIPKLYFLVIVSVLAFFLAWVFQDKIKMYFTFDVIDEAWSRAIILYYSFIIGNDFFPLGTGFGTFSSFYSGVDYSWVYDLYGIDKVYGISRLYNKFIADQYWPMVLGQFGYLGLLSMIFVIYNYFTLFITEIKENINSHKYYYFLSAILGLLLLLIDSTSDAIFTQQRAVVLFIYFALVVNTTNIKDENITNK